ncbi:MAG: DUF58 domain-containing protein, partial [Bacteroidota bacterium]
RESRFPRLGIAPLFDKESQKTVWKNTSSKTFRSQLEKTFSGNTEQLETLCNRSNISYLRVRTDEDYTDALVKLFRVRAVRPRRR